MSKENMSKKNILDYDEEKTIRPQNFTLTAMKEFYDTIESDQFQGASEDTIYKYLTNIMEIVSFKDFLRRYIYEYAGIKENRCEILLFYESEQRIGIFYWKTDGNSERKKRSDR